MVWSLCSKEGILAPLRFSNGKTQEDVVNEVLRTIDNGNKVIFIHGKCGTGKSAIALNLAKEMGKSSVVVPGKNLQAQYKKDYEEDKFLEKAKGKKLQISVITGRKNHLCQFIKDNDSIVPRKEVNSKLYDIFEGKREKMQELRNKGKTADNNSIPCKIPLSEKNWKKIREYLKQNPKVDETKFLQIKDVRRVSVASTCPYWSPVLPKKYDFKIISNADKRTYMGLNGEEFVQYKRKPGCPYYEQFDSYIDSDVMVFNSMKYKLESALNRKPLTEVEIIDECDEFLDSLSNSRTINFDRLQNTLFNLVNFGDFEKSFAEEIIEIIKNIKKNERIQKAVYNSEIIPLKATGIYDLLKLFLKEKMAELLDSESYAMEVLETSYVFKDFFEESYVTMSKVEDNLIANIITINLAKKFGEIIDKNKVVVLMSGTIHSSEVLKNIFGLENFKIIDAETNDLGKIEVVRTGYERDFKYANFSNGSNSRKDYLVVLDKCLENAKRPTLVHVNAFSDLPNYEEIEEFRLKNLISRQDVKNMQSEDGEGKLVDEFKSGKRDILFSTRDSRGVDFPGEQCNSIVFTKYPNPNVKDPFWKILNLLKPTNYWSFYKDKARRELLQKVYRGLRFHGDHLYVLSPDTRILDFFERR